MTATPIDRTSYEDTLNADWINDGLQRVSLDADDARESRCGSEQTGGDSLADRIESADAGWAIVTTVADLPASSDESARGTAQLT